MKDFIISRIHSDKSGYITPSQLKSTCDIILLAVNGRWRLEKRYGQGERYNK